MKPCIEMALMAVKEILKVLDGEKPLNVINPEIYGLF